MKKEKTIIIKDPKLRNIRNELRTLLRLWVSEVESSLIKQKMSYNDRQEYTDLQKSLSELHLLYVKSICICLFCGKNDKDMIFIPKMDQWLCLDCNLKRIHFENLRSKLQINKKELSMFFNKLISDDGISLSREGSRCNGYATSKKILDEMNIKKETQKDFFALCGYYGGHCDCEIIFNAKSRFLEGF